MLELINVKARRVKQGKCELELLEVQ
jgi:hypothetical protein